MINKIYKIIHNKYLTLFKFIFYIRYLFGISFVAIALFFIITSFFFKSKKCGINKNKTIERKKITKRYLKKNIDLNTYCEYFYKFYLSSFLFL